VIRSLRSFGAYLVGKTDEGKDLDLEDLLMAKVILDIHRKRVRRLNRLRRLNNLL